MGTLIDWFLSSDFMPHGHCYLWKPGLVWLEVVSNLFIGLAYLSISSTLIYLVRRIRDIPFQRMYLAFGVFIVTCGLTHFMDIVVIWHPIYWFDAGIRVITAVASVGTAIILFPLVPKAVALAQTAKVAHERGLALKAVNVELATLYQKTRETLAEAIPQLVWTATPDGGGDYCNRRWQDFTGLSGSESMEWHRVLHPDEAEYVKASWQHSIETGENFEFEHRVRRADGQYQWFIVRALPLRDEHGKILRWFGTCTDITERKRAEREREELLTERQNLVERLQDAVRAREVFLAIAAHELKTPLTPLRLDIDTLVQRCQDRDAEPLTTQALSPKLERVNRQVQRLQLLVNALLDVSRIRSGHLEISRETVELASLAREACERLEADRRAVGCTLEIVAITPVFVAGDHVRIDQVVTNLVSNSIRYAEGKPVRVTVSAEAGFGVLTVRDEGIGIAPDDQERIFELFERASPDARHVGGLGLGLWLVRQLVQAMGGAVQLDSQLGAGTTFTVRLPLTPTEHAILVE
jgi:PAS domain S-box-containing protein